jgi:hypothetical protein
MNTLHYSKCNPACRFQCQHGFDSILPAPAVPHSSEVQQPMRTTAVLGRHPRTHYAAAFGHEQGYASSLHPEGQRSVWTRCGPSVTSATDPRSWAHRQITDSGAVSARVRLL